MEIYEHNGLLVGLVRYSCKVCGWGMTMSDIAKPVDSCAKCGSKDIDKKVGDQPLHNPGQKQPNPALIGSEGGRVYMNKFKEEIQLN